ncbi:CAP domain-containing protein [Bacillus sp. EB01]|uniref:CAP domain-containing protein n=1 Tax=Bacillus sp. EB01 TaxID=1347086 RepID=UPI003FA409CB
MIKKTIGLAMAALLVFGLAACNNNGNDNATDHGTGAYNVRNNGDRDNNNDFFGMDNEGLLTEEWDPGHNDDDREGRSDTFGNDRRDGKQNGKRNDNGNWFGRNDLSSIQTSMSSRNYPHTQPVLIRPAEYQFVRMDEQNRAINQQGQNQQLIPGAMPPVTNQGQLPGAGQQGQGFYPQLGQQQGTAQLPQQQTTNRQQPAAGPGISQMAQQVIDLTNVQRQQNGLPPLQADTQLSGVAQRKSLDMAQNNYFSHTSPTYGSPFDMMRDFGVSYRTAGENIAVGQRSAQEVVQAWMNSEGHRRNILNREFTHIGVGFLQNSNHWTQMFIGK